MAAQKLSRENGDKLMKMVQNYAHMGHNPSKQFDWESL